MPPDPSHYPGYHPGERAVQARAGVVEQADRNLRGLGREIPAIAAAFLAEQPFLILGWVDPTGRVWCSLLTGEPGFVRALDETTVEIVAEPAPGDPLASVDDGDRLGALVIDPATRRRMRLNGIIAHSHGGRLVIDIEEVVANCPKYITERHHHVPGPAGTPSPGLAQRADCLSERQVQWVRTADTFFLATAESDRGGVDASHRGGNPGFVHVENDRRLLWPDYAGNAMFLSLGNLEVNPRAGVLFVDWDRGSLLQLTGTARVDWNPAAAAQLIGAERLVAFDVEAVVELPGVTALRWELGGYSRFNP